MFNHKEGVRKIKTQHFHQSSDIIQCENCGWEISGRDSGYLKMVRNHVKESGHKVRREYSHAVLYSLITNN